MLAAEQVFQLVLDQRLLFLAKGDDTDGIAAQDGILETALDFHDDGIGLGRIRLFASRLIVPLDVA